MMEGITSSLNRVLEASGIRRRLLLQMTSVIWSETVGDSIACHTHVDRAKDGVLYVSTDNPVWAQELTLLRLEIVERINARLGEDVVKEIRFRTRQRGKQKTSPRAVLHPGPAEIEKVELPEKQRLSIEEFAATIPDDELRRHVASWGIKVAKIREWEKRHPLRTCPVCHRRFRSRKKTCPACAPTSER